MDADSSMQIMILIILLIFSALFSSSETAFLSVNRIRLRNMAEEEDNQKAALVLSMLEQQSRLVSALLVGNNIVNIGSSAMATKMATDFFGNAGVGIATGIMTFLVLVFGEVIPKNLAAAHAEGWAMRIAPFIRLITVILTPIVVLLSKLSDMVVHASKNDEEDDPTITEDELKLLVNVSQEEGVLDESESDMINSIIEFDETPVKAIMVPRIDIVAVDEELTLEEALAVVVEDGHSRIPVYKDSIDNIVGILYAKDLLSHMGQDFQTLRVGDVIREAYFIPETKKVSDLLNEMRLKKVHMAIILDEYGGTNGLVTFEDLIEEIIGDIQDEYDVEDDLIQMSDETHMTADARTPIKEVEEAFDMEVDEELLEESEADTIGGLVFEQLGEIPEKGDEVSIGRWNITVTEVIGRTVSKVEVELLPEESDEEEDEKEKE